MLKRATTLLLILCLSIVLVGCEQQESRPNAEPAMPDEPTDGKLTLVAANYPVYYFASRVGGDLASCELPVPPGEDPAYWEPDSETIRAMQDSDLIILNGAGSEKWLSGVTVPGTKLLDTSAGFSDRHLDNAHAVVHSHGPGEEHVHKGKDFNVWLNPELAILQAESIAISMQRRFPESVDGIKERKEELKSDLLTLDAELSRLLTPIQDAPILASHPVYNYLAARYGIDDLYSFHWEPSDFPPDQEWDKLDEYLEENPATLMLWEDEPLDETADRLKEKGIRVVVFQTANNRPGEGDYLSVMKQNVKRLEDAIHNK